jgi:hypothetical protein
MKLEAEMTSQLTVEIAQDGTTSDDEWGMEAHVKAVPKGLWGKCESMQGSLLLRVLHTG